MRAILYAYDSAHHFLRLLPSVPSFGRKSAVDSKRSYELSLTLTKRALHYPGADISRSTSARPGPTVCQEPLGQAEQSRAARF